MTYDEFLDNEKTRGVIIYRCGKPECDFRGMGAAVTYHERKPGHMCYNEDRKPEKEGVKKS